MSAVPLKTWIKDPNATLDYKWNWKPWLTDINDSIASVAWPSFPAGLTQVSTWNTANEAGSWISGGTVDTDYEVTCRITTVGGRTEDRTCAFHVRAR